LAFVSLTLQFTLLINNFLKYEDAEYHRGNTTWVVNKEPRAQNLVFTPTVRPLPTSVNSYTRFPPIQGYTSFPPPLSTYEQSMSRSNDNIKKQTTEIHPSVEKNHNYQEQQQQMKEQELRQEQEQEEDQLGKELELRILKFLDMPRGKQIKKQIETFPQLDLAFTKDSLKYGFSRMSSLENYIGTREELSNEEDRQKKVPRTIITYPKNTTIIRT